LKTRRKAWSERRGPGRRVWPTHSPSRWKETEPKPMISRKQVGMAHEVNYAPAYSTHHGMTVVSLEAQRVRREAERVRRETSRERTEAWTEEGGLE